MLKPHVCAALLLICSTPALSQSGVNDYARQGEGLATFNERFNDPGDHTASSLAKLENISLEEARLRLRHMVDANHFIAAVEKEFPDIFAGGRIEKYPSAGVTLQFKGEPSTQVADRVRQLSSMNRLTGGLQFTSSPYSRKELLALGENVFSQLEKKGHRVVVSVDPLNGGVKLLAQNPTNVLDLIKAKQIFAQGFPGPVSVSVEHFDGITLTYTLIGSKSYNAQFYSCTTGFTVMRTSDHVKGISSAGHCSYPARYDWYASSDYNNPTPSDNAPLQLRSLWTTNNLDVLMASSTRSGDVHEASISTASGVFTSVTGGLQDAAGTFVCKTGRATNITCGYIDAADYLDSPFGYFRRVNANASYPIMNNTGDSGAPVYQGSLAVGTVHGKDASGNMYFGPLWRWQAGNVGFGVVCNPCL